MPNIQQLRRKADEYLRAALEAPDGPERTHLIGKAAYWNKAAVAAAQPAPQPREPWNRGLLRRTG